MDRVIARLQRKYDVFKTKTPLLSGAPPSAYIGMKEGLEGGDKFEVLEAVMDDGKVTYKRIKVIKVDKKRIWDNRYRYGGEMPEDPLLDRTYFKGKVKKFREGLLIKQIK